MSRVRICQPLRHTLTRPLITQPRNVFIGATTLNRSIADVVKPDELELDGLAKSELALASRARSPAHDPRNPEDLPNVIPDKDADLPLPFMVRNDIVEDDKRIRLPRAVQALYLQPLRREAEYGVPTCDLQLRSYSVPNLEFFCDFALRAAYYLNLPAFGPIPLPRITERWTVPRSHFIFKKSQENFERITLRRLIQIRDGHPETIQIWLAFLQKHAYYGIGMKANVWEYSKLDVGKQMDSELKSFQDAVEEKMQHLGRRKVLGTVEKVKELLESERFRHQEKSRRDWSLDKVTK